MEKDFFSRLLEQEGIDLSTSNSTTVEYAVKNTAAIGAGAIAKYDNWKAITHAKTYCGQTNNECGDFYDRPGKTDCAHFIAHCLNAGGITIKPSNPSDTTCPMGLSMRNTDLVAALKKLAKDCDNVSELGMIDAIIG